MSLRREALPGNRRIAVIAFHGISLFHLAIPGMVFGEDRTDGGVPRFEVQICASEPGPLSTSTGITIVTSHGLDAVRHADTVIVPSWRDPEEQPSEALLEALRQAAGRGACLVGLCLGSWVLAAAGLLDGRPATTHWISSAAFTRRYPRIHVDPRVLYIDDGDVLTSAGAAAGIDCCLHLLRRWCGTQAAGYVARRLVVPLHRAGGQAQYIERPIPARAEDERLSKALDWARTRLDEPLGLDSLARQACMSRRTFTREFRRATGASPGQWLRDQRVALAQRLLETTDQPVERIAHHAGFGTAASLRQHFKAMLGISPSAFRERFRGH